MKFKKGDVVMVAGKVVDENPSYSMAGDFTGWPIKVDVAGGGVVKATYVHPMPPVPVADLLEEIKLLHNVLDRCYTYTDDLPREIVAPLKQLQRAREAASRPKYREGDEVWVKVRVRRPSAIGGPSVRYENTAFHVHPDDIKEIEDE